MRNNEDYMIVNEGEIWRCSGTTESYDYLVLYVGGGFITGYVLSTYGPKSRDERGITVHDTTYWYHPAKINYVRKNRLDYRLYETVGEQTLNDARRVLTIVLGCNDELESLRNENRTLRAGLEAYRDAFRAVRVINTCDDVINDLTNSPTQTIKSPLTDEETKDIHPSTSKKRSAYVSTMQTFYRRLDIDDYLAYVRLDDICCLTSNTRTRSTNILCEYLESRFGYDECYPISKQSIAMIVRDSDFTGTKGIGKYGLQFLQAAFPLSLTDSSEEDSNEE